MRRAEYIRERGELASERDALIAKYPEAAEPVPVEEPPAEGEAPAPERDSGAQPS